MKKILAIILTLSFICISASCSLTPAEKATQTDGTAASGTDGKNICTVADFYENGYSCVMSSASEDSIGMLFELDSSYFTVEAEITAEQYEEYEAIDATDEDYDKKLREFYISLEGVVITDITDKVPGEAELSRYIGKTVGELENDGFEENGVNTFAEGCTITFTNGYYDFNVKIKDWVDGTDFDALSDEEKDALVIGTVDFGGFSWGIFD